MRNIENKKKNFLVHHSTIPPFQSTVYTLPQSTGAVLHYCMIIYLRLAPRWCYYLSSCKNKTAGREVEWSQRSSHVHEKQMNILSIYTIVSISDNSELWVYLVTYFVVIVNKLWLSHDRSTSSSVLYLYRSIIPFMGWVM